MLDISDLQIVLRIKPTIALFKKLHILENYITKEALQLDYSLQKSRLKKIK